MSEDNSQNELIDLVHTRIERMRPKLLDLSRRNPLISTRFSGRTNSYIRVVDELPEVLFYELPRGNALKFEPLPALDETPADERTESFEAALTEARATDESYAELLDALDPADEEFLEKSQKAERELRDRVRESLGMAPRQTNQDLSLAQHARNNHISPSFELPLNEERADDGRHDDDLIQTLLLPDELERTANRLITKCRSWQLETGLNVMQGAFGFLEWRDPNSRDRSFSPLVLLPVAVERKARPNGPEYVVSGTGEPGEMNMVLAEKLRLELGIDLPAFESGSIEDYLQEVADAAPKGIEWRVRRYVAFGVFPSSRLAMYHDLDTSDSGFVANDIVMTVLGGSEAGGEATPFAEDYPVDEPEIEAKVPLLVTEADSSQFSTLVDIADGKNLAVEGPPGTGKSQTIVNAIAAAIADGKKVLFVAEKLAALDVVRSRLEHMGLAEFLLPLQATQSSRQQVAHSIAERLALGNERVPRNLETRQSEFREARDRIGEYVSLMRKDFGETGLTVHNVLGSALKTGAVLEDLPRELQVAALPHAEKLDNEAVSHIRQIAGDLEKAERYLREGASAWQGLTVTSVDRFTADDLLHRAGEASVRYRDAAEKRGSLGNSGIPDDRSYAGLRELGDTLDSLESEVAECDIALVLEAMGAVDPEWCVADLDSFLEGCETSRELSERLSGLFSVDPDTALLGSLEEILDICRRYELDTFDQNELTRRRENLDRSVAEIEQVGEELGAFVREAPQLANVPVAVLGDISERVDGTNRRTLLLRTAGTAEAGAAETLRALVTQGEALLERQKVFARTFVVETLPSGNELIAAAAVLRDGNFLSFFSSEFRAAKALWKKVRRGQGVRHQDAAESFLELGTWKLEVEAFAANPRYGSLLPDGFRGLATDFAGYGELAGYLETVDAAFPALAMRPVRSFLKSADIDILEAIPDVAGFKDREIAFPEFAPRVERSRVELENLDRAMQELQAPATCVLDTGEVTLAVLPELIGHVRKTIALRESLLANSNAKNLLGERYRGVDTRRNRFEKELAVSKLLLESGVDRSILTTALRTGSFQTMCERVADYLIAHHRALEALRSLQQEVGAPDVPGSLGLAEVAELLGHAANDREGLNQAALFKSAYAELEARGFGDILLSLEEAGIPFENLPNILEAIVRRAASIALYRDHGEILQRYSGMTLDRLREKLATADREILGLSQQELRARLIGQARPPAGRGTGRKSEFTELALLQNEANKQRGFFPMRHVVRRAGSALQELKPCWMMSPLAISQYMPRGTVEFDLCIIDEASQMTPENSIGALMRARQTVVVGDTNQLPPTSFFRKMIVDEEVDEDETVLEESILELANAAFHPKRQLRWHYRSRHSGLIRFSNRLIYDDNLIVFPSAAESHPDMGVSLVRVEDGIYKSGANPREAQTIVEAVLEFMHTHPERSLGVVTLNQKQRDLIQEELDHAISRDGAALDYVDRWNNERDGLESFFVKNLENVQGDERDVIYIGTVYGPQEPGGRVFQRFGPINGLAGRRRLNVLFSRAKQQIVTFSSMTTADITADENGNPGAYMLKRWLEYAANGRLEAGEVEHREPDSDFEIFVADQIRAMGCEPVPQVGVAGYFIDIGVRHPNYPHGFLLGVECDGATYHSSRSARDRDRLRQEILEGLGWSLHRIWSTDWFNDPTAEATRLREVIEERLYQELAKARYPGPAERPESDEDELEGSVGALEQEPQMEAEGSEPGADLFDGVEAGSNNDTGIRAGDTVLVRYISGDEGSLRVTLSDRVTDPDNRIIHTESPLGQALLGMEEGDEVEVLVGARVRQAEIEKIIRTASSD